MLEQCFSNCSTPRFPGAAFSRWVHLILTLIKLDKRWSKKLSQQRIATRRHQPREMGSLRQGLGLRPQIVLPTSGAFRRKSLEALPASGPFCSPAFSLHFLCLDRQPRPTSWPAQWPPAGAKQAPAKPGPALASDPALPPSPPSALRSRPLSRAALTRGSSSSILRGDGRGRWPPPRSGFGAGAETGTEPTVLSPLTAEALASAAPSRGRAGISRDKTLRPPRRPPPPKRSQMRNQHNLAREGFALPRPSPTGTGRTPFHPALF